MKKMIFALTLLSTLAAQASHFREFQQNEMDLTNTLIRLCPQELVQIMNAPHSEIIQAKLVGGETEDGISTTYNIVVRRGYPMPAGHVEKQSLTIKEVVRYVTNDIPDHPGREVDVECKIGKVEGL